MKERTIYALGFFDGMHLGHQALLSACKALAAENHCAPGIITFDLHPETRISGAAPLLLCGGSIRTELLHRYGAEKIYFLPFTESLRKKPWQDFLLMLREQFDAAGFVCGDDFRFGYQGQGNAALLQAYCEEQGLPCAVVPEQTLDGTRISSTHIRKLLENGEVETANRFLGHPYVLSGLVVSGQQLGRTIDVPTANIYVPEHIMLPKNGVYACKVKTGEGAYHMAVTNIGHRPTVNGQDITVEAWILDFDDYLYNWELTLEVHAYLRPEKKFSSLEELKAQIQKDAQKTRDLLKKS